jgi:hypothetical protein
MPHQIGYVDNAGGVLAHYKMLAVIRDFAAANGWTVLRYDTASANRELILKGSGYTGDEEIFIGCRTYQDAGADYYNLVVAGFTGYVPGNSFDTQPGAKLSGLPAHNVRIDYWLTINPQRIALGMKVGTPVYITAYAGKFLPYGRPSQYPYPLAVGGVLNGAESKRFSDTGNSAYFKGNRAQMQMLSPAGWQQPYCYPWGNLVLSGTTSYLRDTGGNYKLLPIELHDNTANLWGYLDGICMISGFGNATENTLVINGETWVVLQDVWRTGFSDYIAMRMDA